jgi:L-arabinose isomerase
MTNGRITDLGYPVSCEGDANGALSMLIQQAMVTGKKTPSLVDILTAHPDEDKLVLAWHCGNASVSNKHAESDARIMPQCPWSDKFGRKAGAASMELMLKSGFSTINSLIEHNGQYKLSNFFVEMVKRDDNIRGAWSWFEVPDREKFYEKLVYEGFPHHTSLIYEDLRDPIKEFCRYLDIKCIGF